MALTSTSGSNPNTSRPEIASYRVLKGDGLRNRTNRYPGESSASMTAESTLCHQNLGP